MDDDKAKQDQGTAGAGKPGETDAKPHKVDEKTQERAAEERAENPGYD